jgi:hypothetical protein
MKEIMSYENIKRAPLSMLKTKFEKLIEINRTNMRR